MGARSTVTRNPAIHEAVNQAIKRGCTIDEIKEIIDSLGANISRSALGRYSKKFNELASRQRDIRAASAAFAGEFGDANDKQTQLLIQLLTTQITENIIAAAPGQQNPMELRLNAAAVKDAVTAAKIDDERRRAIRKEALAEAASAAEKAGKKAGASPEAINAIKAQILGIDG
jgi:hypothetical protein